MKQNRITSAGHSSNTLVSRSQFKPILFSTDMVKAILSGDKTQTRRRVPEKIVDAYYDYDDWASSVGMPEGISCTRTYEKEYFMDRCKYSVGDILWVRETWQVTDFIHREDENWGYIYKASKNGRDWESNDDEWKWKPSIFMPKEACRIFLEVTGVRVERIKDINEDDAHAEGIVMTNKPHESWYWMENVYSTDCPIFAYLKLWEKINGQDSLVDNDWVYVITFKVVECP